MMPAANQGVGMNMGFPDVCTTPAAPSPIPIPYPNIGMNAMAMPFVPNVLLSMAPAQNMSAKPMLTNGDNAGVAHPMFMQPGGTTVGNPRILIGGMPAAHLGVPTYGNNFNNPVGSKIVPSITNVLLGCAATLLSESRLACAASLRRSAGTARVDALLELRLPVIGLASDRWLARCLGAAAGRTLRGCVLDLRGNPGGSVAVARRLATQLLATDLPIAVLVDRDTASAAELLAALLQPHAQVRVFGETTRGKWCGQRFLVHDGGLSPFGPAGFDFRPRSLRGERGVQPSAPTDTQRARPEARRWLLRRHTWNDTTTP